MHAIEKFKEIAAQEKFKGWPLAGKYRLGGKIPYFGQILEYELVTGNGVEPYVSLLRHNVSLLRHFGWSVVFGITTKKMVMTNIQWKPGINAVEWGLSPGGIGRVVPNAPFEEILRKTQEFFLKETGLRKGTWIYLDQVMIESGKFRGARPEDHGVPAHLFLALDLEEVASPTPLPNEIMEKLLVPLEEFQDVLDERPRRFKETSSVACAYAALWELRKMGRVK